MARKTVKNNDRVVELLQDAIQTRIERNEMYGEHHYGGSYKQHGHVKKALLPHQILLVNAEDHNRHALLDMIVGKLIRYCNNFEDGGHADSLKDIAVYSQMLLELDEEIIK